MERFDNDPWGGMRLGGIFQVVNDTGVLQIQFPGGGVDAVAFLSDGERNDSHLRLAKFLNDGGQRIQFRVQAFMHGPNDNGLVALRAFLQHGEEMILGPELAHQHIAAEEADLTDAPVASFGIQHAIGQQRLMRAVKGTKAEMDDARAQMRAIVARLLNMGRKRGGGNCLHKIHT